MSWLNDYKKEKREKEKAENQRLVEENRRTKIKERQRAEEERKWQQKMKELSPMVVSLLKDIGRSEYGRNWFWKFLIFRNYSVKFDKDNHAWELNGPSKYVRTESKYGSYSGWCWQFLKVQLILEENTFFFAVGIKSEKTQDVSRLSLQSTLLKTLKEKTALGLYNDMTMDDHF